MLSYVLLSSYWHAFKAMQRSTYVIVAESVREEKERCPGHRSLRTTAKEALDRLALQEHTTSSSRYLPVAFSNVIY